MLTSVSHGPATTGDHLGEAALMPRGKSMFPSELFNDEGFRQLDDGPQRLLMWLWLHPDLNGAGVIAIQPREWAAASANLTDELVQDYAKQLRSQNWVDYDGGQLWIRPFMLLDGVLKSTSTYIATARAVKTIRSRRLRQVVWQMFQTFERPYAPLPDPGEGNYDAKVKRAAGLNASVEAALSELRDSVSNPGVRESLPGTGGMPHPMPPPMPPRMGRVGVGAGDEGGGGIPAVSLNGNSCGGCSRHPALKDGLCSACLGRAMEMNR